MQLPTHHPGTRWQDYAQHLDCSLQQTGFSGNCFVIVIRSSLYKRAAISTPRDLVGRQQNYQDGEPPYGVLTRSKAMMCVLIRAFLPFPNITPIR